MMQYADALTECPLFYKIAGADLRTLLDCLGAAKKHYEKNRFIFMPGDAVTTIGIVLSGSVHIVQDDFWGDRTILANISSGGMFGEAFACSELKRLPVGVLAAQACDIVFIDYRRIITTCSSACSFHAALVGNMLRILAGKNVMLTQKIEIITRRTTREKLLSYLCAQARQAGSGSFTIPFNRQELAEYLAVDRSAMSSELSKMRAEGILRFHRSSFELLEPVER